MDGTRAPGRGGRYVAVMIILGAALGAAVAIWAFSEPGPRPASAPAPLPPSGSSDATPAGEAAVPPPAVPERAEPATAGAIPTPSKPAPARMEDLVVRVTNPVDGRPLAGARVVAEGRRQDAEGEEPVIIEATTGPDGNAVLPLDPFAENYRVRIEATDHAPRVLNVQWKEGRGYESRDVELQPAGVIEGRVLEPSGKPVPGARVFLDGSEGRFLLDEARNKWRWTRPKESEDLAARLLAATTGPDGSFRIPGLPIATPLRLFAAGSAFAPSPWHHLVRIPADSRLLRENLSLTWGASLFVRFEDTEGQLIAGPDRAWIGTSLGYRPLEAGGGEWRATELEAGSFTLLAVSAAHAPISVTIPLVDGETRTETIVLHPGHALAGSVVDGRGYGVAGATVESEMIAQGVLESLATRTATTDASGAFSLDGLSRHVHLVGVRGNETGYLFRQGSVSPPKDDMRLDACASVRATLRAPRGRPLTGKEDVRAWVTSPKFTRMTPLDEPGNVSLDSKTGELRIRETLGGSCSFRIHVRGFVRLECDTDLEPGALGDLGTLELVPGNDVSGTVSGPDGRGVAGIEIHAWYPTGSHPLYARTNHLGRYRLTDLAEGPVVLEARDVIGRETRYALATRAVFVGPAGGSADFGLERGGQILVQVRTADDRPASAAYVTCDPAGASYRPLPEPLVEHGAKAGTWMGRRPVGVNEVRLFEYGTDRILDRANVRLYEGRTATVTLRLRE